MSAPYSTNYVLQYMASLNATGYQEGIRKMQNETQKMGKSSNKVFAGIGQKISTLVNPTNAFIATIAAAAYQTIKSVKDFAKFQAQLSKVNTLLKVGQKELNKYGEEILSLSAKTGMAKDQIAEGLYQALSAGVSSKDSMQFMEIATKTAIAGFTDVNTAVDGLTTVINAYKMETKDAARIADIFLKGQELGKITVDEIGKSIGSLASISASAGVSVENLVASLASMTANGIPANEAATQLKQAMAQLTNSGSNASKAFIELTGQNFKDFIQQGGTLAEAFNKIEQASRITGKSITELMGSVEAGNAVLSLTGLNGAKAAENLNKIAAASGTLEEAYKLATDNIMGDWKKLVSSMDLLWKNVVKGLEKPIRVTLQVTNKAVSLVNGEAFNGITDGFEDDKKQRYRNWEQEARNEKIRAVELEKWLEDKEKEFQERLSKIKEDVKQFSDPDSQLDLNYTPGTITNNSLGTEEYRQAQKDAEKAEKEVLERKEKFYINMKTLEDRYKADALINEQVHIQELNSLKEAGLISEQEYNQSLADLKYNQEQEEKLRKINQLTQEIQFMEAEGMIQSSILEKKQEQQDLIKGLYSSERVIEKKRIDDLKNVKELQLQLEERYKNDVFEIKKSVLNTTANVARQILNGELASVKEMSKAMLDRLGELALGEAQQALVRGWVDNARGSSYLAAGNPAQASLNFAAASQEFSLSAKLAAVGAASTIAGSAFGSGDSGGGVDGTYNDSSSFNDSVEEASKESEGDVYIDISDSDMAKLMVKTIEKELGDGYNVILTGKKKK